MKFSQVSSQRILLILFISSSFYVNSLKFNNIKLRRRILNENDSNDDFKIFFFNQTLDHFNYGPKSYTIFQQRYAINFKHWDGGNAPILAFLGAEEPIDIHISDPSILTDTAPKFKALIVIMEHRYYGKSVPFGSMKEALKNATIRGFFNSAQALADYASILLHIKEKYNAMHAPVIAIGGSYGGELATWFRLKYPHVVIGSLASSASILYYGDTTPATTYYDGVTKDFRDTSEICFQTILKSWSEIDNVASKPDGLAILSKQFKTCNPLQNTTELKESLEAVYYMAAQYDNPGRTPVKRICKAIEKAPNCGNDILCKIAAGVVEADKLNSANLSMSSCYINEDKPVDEADLGWEWQLCSEKMSPMSKDKNSMFPPAPFNLTQYMKECMEEYGVSPRPFWILTYYGGTVRRVIEDIKLILQRFASNIIFSNGMRDPYSRGGVLESISESIIALPTENGSHCLDLYALRKYDPYWLVQQRKTEEKIMQGWLSQYYADLKEINSSTSYLMEKIKKIKKRIACFIGWSWSCF